MPSTSKKKKDIKKEFGEELERLGKKIKTGEIEEQMQKEGKKIAKELDTGFKKLEKGLSGIFGSKKKKKD